MIRNFWGIVGGINNPRRDDDAAEKKKSRQHVANIDHRPVRIHGILNVLGST